MTEAVGRRARQAQQTRRDIIDAARRLFGERGYSATSVKDVAVAAGVSVQTVYDSVGRKPALLAALNDAIDESARVGELAQQAIAVGTTEALLALGPRITREIIEHSGDIVRIATNAAATEPELRRIRAEGLARHRVGAHTVCELLHKRRVLRRGLRVDAASETLAAITDVDVALMLSDHYRWNANQIESWMTTTAKTLLLEPNPRQR
jgi:TetR/AcrR family transcriptional regulator, regulator of cefoperazone and chloramphenicol sensitivity